jgi:hypothetical protein
MKFLIIFFLLCSPCFAQVTLKDKVMIEKDAGKDVFKDSKGKKYDMSDVVLTSQFTFKKPVIDDKKILTEDEKDVVEYSLKENGRKLVHKEVRPVKNDYQNDFDRGTVAWTSKARNYSFHKIVIPDGTTIRDTNFSQKEPHTVAIEGENLTFENCNMVNNVIRPSWTLIGCNACQIKRVIKKQEDTPEGRKKLTISHQVEQKDGKFLEVEEDTEIYNVGDDLNLAIQRYQ